MESLDGGGAARRGRGRGGQNAVGEYRGGQNAVGEYRDALYGEEQDYDGMVRTVGAMVDDVGARIRVLVLRSDDLPGVLRSWTPRRYKLEVEALGDKTVLDLKRVHRSEDPDAAGLRIAIAEMPDSPHYYCAVSDCSSAEFKDVFARFISRHSPDISRLFLTNEDMKGILESIKSEGYDINVRYGSAKSSEQSTGAHKSVTTSTTVPFDVFFDKLEKDAEAATTVRYEAIPNGSGKRGARDMARGSIARDCRFSASSNAEILFGTAIPSALSLPLERNHRIEEVAKSAERDAVEPMVIRFSKKIFDDKSKNRRYVDTIAKMPDSSISTYHANPHIHLSLVDYTDGSSYDIWVVTNDRLAIIPQIRASGASLKRLVNHILVHMGEGSVEKYEH